MKKIILGVGTGRCGTVSLSNLLNFQEDCSVSHELSGKSVDWYGGENQFKIIERSILSYPTKFIGDVSFYHLPFLKYFCDKNEDIKIIILKRNKQEVIESFQRKAPLYDHWRENNGHEFRKAHWDRCFPKFNAPNRHSAIGLYYDHYYSECEKLDQSKCFWIQTPELNDEARITEMLSWCGFENPIFKKFHKNRT